MPVNHNNRSIFVHIPKTAGTSIESALGMHGDVDYIGIQPYNDQKKDGSVLFGGGLQHLTAMQIREIIGPESFGGYFKFSVVRNPYDRVVSFLSWVEGRWSKKKILSFEEFKSGVESIYDNWLNFGFQSTDDFSRVDRNFMMPQHAFLTDENGGIMVDYVCDYSNLKNDWGVICKKIGVEVELPVRMKSFHLHYKEYYDEDSKRMIRNMYEADLDMFKFVF